jgi:putative phosphoesterase
MPARRAAAPRIAAPPKLVHARTAFPLDGPALRIVAVADTHSHPHRDLQTRLRELAPARIFHAGDVGDLGVLRDLERIAPVTAVRGNIDGHELPDVVTIDVRSGEVTLIRILLTHIAVYGPKLRADVARMAQAEDASLVVCGHSHVPFAAHDRGITVFNPGSVITVFNPGSVGPRRFQLPIVLGAIDVSATGVSVRHIDCETGAPWRPAPRAG